MRGPEVMPHAPESRAPAAPAPPAPAGGRPEVLAANLAALEEARPELARRLALPADLDRIVLGAAGEPRYRFRRALLPLAAPAAGPPPGAERVLVLGPGLGEEVERALATPGVREVRAWERDPALLRLWLARRDVAEALRARRLVPLLGTDLLDEDRDLPAVLHPVLAGVHAEEIRTFRAGLGAKRACVCAGGLFVDQLAAALRAEGWSLWSLDLAGAAREELERALARFRPSVVVAVNYVNGLAELCRDQGCELVCWEVDPTTTAPRARPDAARRARLFTWRRASVEPLRRAGFARARHLPLAADPEVRRPVEVAADEARSLGGPLSFVGSSLVENALACRARFVAARRARRPPATAEEAEALLERLLARQRADFTRWLVPEALEEEVPGWRAAALAAGEEDPALLASEAAAAEKRLSYVASLARLGIAVRGDVGWRLVERHGVRWLGPALHKVELTRVYNASVVNVDVNRLYQADIVTMRTFDVLACGRLALVEHAEELDELFRVGVELESYRTLDELRDKARWYLEHPELAADVGRRGREAVLARHTIRARLAELLPS